MVIATTAALKNIRTLIVMFSVRSVPRSYEQEVLLDRSALMWRRDRIPPP
jgi:hypothetical protein